MTDQTIRLSDAEREAAAADLGEHFAQGRLTADEHARAARAGVGREDPGRGRPDLPRPAQPVRRGRVRAVGRAGDDRYWNSGLRPFRRGVPAPLLVVLAVLIVVSAVAHFPLFLLGFARASGSWCSGTAARAARTPPSGSAATPAGASYKRRCCGFEPMSRRSSSVPSAMGAGDLDL